MKQIIIFLLLQFSISAIAAPGKCDSSLSVEAYQDCFAFTSIVRGIVIPSSYKDVYEIPEQWRNIRTLPWELGLIILDRSNSKESLKSLAYLSAFSLDGALAEDHACITLKKGKEILPYLNNVVIDSKTICPTIMKNIGIDGGNKCKAEPVVIKQTQDLIKLINKGVLCEK